MTCLAVPRTLAVHIRVLGGVLVVRWAVGLCYFPVYLSPFSHHVRHIIKLGTEEQMVISCGLAARRIITVVQDANPWRDWSALQFPREPVGAGCLGARAYYPVTIFGRATSPLKTTVRFRFKSAVESLGNRSMGTSHTHNRIL